jgi:nucleoside 2-deoxyribosyltransferase
MRVYLAAAMTNPTRDLGVVLQLLHRIEELGHEVPTRHVAAPNAPRRDGSPTHAELAARDIAWLHSSDALVAEVTTPSHGVGIEVAFATRAGKPVLLLHRQDVVVSRLLLGLPGGEQATYRDAGEACAAVEKFLARVVPATMSSPTTR